MNILVIGNLHSQGSTNFYMAKALYEMGHRVKGISFGNLRYRPEDLSADYLLSLYGALPPLGPGYLRGVSVSGFTIESVTDAEVEPVRGVTPDLIIVCKFFEGSTKVVKDLAAVAHTHVWMPDPLSNGATSKVIEHAKVATSSSCTGVGVVDYYRKAGVRNCFHIFEGVDPYYIHPFPPEPLLGCDVAFIGSVKNPRPAVARAISKAGYSLRVYGDGWGTRNVYDWDFSMVCSSAKIVLGWNEQNDVIGYFSDRTFLTLAAGGLHLTHYVPGIENFFVWGEHLFWFNGISGMLAAIRNIMENYDKYVFMREKGREYVLSKYTWKHSMQRLLDLVATCHKVGEEASDE